MSAKIKRFILLIILLPLLLMSFRLVAAPSAETSAYQKVKIYTESKNPAQIVIAPEKEFITCFNDSIAGWVEKKLTPALVNQINNRLDPYLKIELNAQGFAKAATRVLETEKDETNYDAIWVRDNVWVYYALLQNPNRRADARKLLLALWDYYATDAQIARFRQIIANPALSTNSMAMPHIRFDGNSPTLDDVMVDGKPQDWNHRQIDAHGLLFIAIGEAISQQLIDLNELTEKRLRVLALYPLFLQRIKFYDYEDAGAWEEIPRKNTSSIALATRSLQVWGKLMSAQNNSAYSKRLKDFLLKQSTDISNVWSEPSLNTLISQGLNTVKIQLRLGGESPNYKPDDVRFRRADAALVVLIQPSPLEGLTEDEMRHALLIIETLKRPTGILRYTRDSYQEGNYWIKSPVADKDAPTLTGDTSSNDAFMWRLSQLIPDTEAQWFFDSLLVLARLHLAEITKNPQLRQQDIHAATVHLKRALGQITGQGLITADGKSVGAWQAPESINTIVIDGRRFFLPSPITPLNWAKAGLSMALDKYETAISQ
ncbi:hypothetical protein C7H19_17485 [Aphanothece hegewaldii CCALA 016]|uniref:GH15-like domain-containing protein n=1 Tax=Aphanothece hegewaldii CCALA 016 TaxID=2107694 RepID=A0A2T1LUK4_9CHRO|nr:glycoside hydrolase family 15 protein [Aphanothece hegewaldii]PSF35174.1 hypothetical protein C7H19_17485 [Aphanothece hegewaldii CCALA 016]